MKHFLAATLAVCCLALSGCVFQTKPDSPGLQVAKIAVQLGVSKFIAKVPESAQAARAARIAKVVADIEALAKGGEGVTLSFLEDAIRQNIPNDLKPEDQIALNALVGLVVAELRARVSEGVLNDSQRVAVASVAGWIEEACSLYAT